jgi:hypothetical protein
MSEKYTESEDSIADYMDTWLESLSPAQRRNSDRRIFIFRITSKLYRYLPWMNWPILKVVYTFWHGIFEDGIKGTIKPRWGLMTFAYLNDGIKPTLWHTWRQVTHSDHTDPYCGIYPRGAPKSLRQAIEWDEYWEAKRWAECKGEEDD